MSLRGRLRCQEQNHTVRFVVHYSSATPHPDISSGPYPASRSCGSLSLSAGHHLLCAPYRSLRTSRPCAGICGLYPAQSHLLKRERWQAAAASAAATTRPRRSERGVVRYVYCCSANLVPVIICQAEKVPHSAVLLGRPTLHSFGPPHFPVLAMQITQEKPIGDCTNYRGNILRRPPAEESLEMASIHS